MRDLLLFNGNVYTQSHAQPQAQAVLVRDGRVRAVGSTAELQQAAPAGVRRFDLGGRLVLPGFTDAHFHYYDWARGLNDLALAHTVSLDDMLRVVAAAASKSAGRWILGQGWNETRWPDQRLPNRSDLDEVAPENPVIVWRSDMHLAVANSQALQHAGINADTVDPADGVIDRDAAGKPTGVLRELAINLVRDAIPLPTEDEAVDAMTQGFTILHRLGITGIHDFRIMGGEEGAAALRAWQRLHAAGMVALRSWVNLPGERLDEAIRLGLRSGFGDDYLRIGHLKYFSDGSQGARMAWMLEPYLDAASGMPLTPMSSLAEAVRRAHQAGLAVAIHAIGDRANRELLSVFAGILEQSDMSQTAVVPHRIEHVQNIRPEDVQRFGRLAEHGLVASMQPLQLADDLSMLEQSLGPRGRYAFPFRDLVAAGVTLALGSDCPVADPNPLLGVHAAVTRQRQDGYPEGGWYSEQCLSVAEAIWGYTMGPAIVCGLQERLGSIVPGKLADMVVLDRDIFAIPPSDIPLAQVDLTVFDGRIVFER